MGKKAVMAITLLLFSILEIFVACGKSKSKSTSNVSDIKIEQKIVFIQQDTNYSDTYVNNGFFINNLGEKVAFDLSDEDMKYGDVNELLNYLEAMEYSEAEQYIDIDNLKKYYSWLYKVDLDYSLEEVSHGADQGSNCLYGIRYDNDKNPIIILLEERGDWDRKNTDKNAIKIVENMRK